jgi:hypothetical protein
MLFFRRRDTIDQSNMTDQELCIHACLFFEFIVLIVTIVLFYLAATYKGTDDQRIYYYIGAGISLAFLILITLCTIVYVRRFYGLSVSSTQQRGINLASEHDSAKYAKHHV